MKIWELMLASSIWFGGGFFIDSSGQPTIFVSRRLWYRLVKMVDMESFGASCIMPWECTGE